MSQISNEDFILVFDETARKANKGHKLWEKIFQLLNDAAPLILHGGPIRWYQVSRIYKLAMLLINFIIVLKDELHQ